ncbi:unnamed protein product [Caenorhabditis brenneri]
MPTTTDKLLAKTYSLKKFIRKELQKNHPSSKMKTLKGILRTLGEIQKELRRLQMTIEVDATLVFRIHHRRILDLHEFQKNLEEQNMKVKQIVVGIMLGQFVDKAPLVKSVWLFAAQTRI